MVDLGAQLDADTAVVDESARSNLMLRTAVAMRLASMHQMSNAAMHKPVADMVGAVNALFEGGEVRLQNVRDCFFVNRQILKLDYDNAESVQMMRRVLRRLSCHEIAFKEELSVEDLREFLTNFQAKIWGQSEDESNNFHPKISLRVLSKAQRESLLKQGDRRQDVLRTYVLLAMSVREIVRKSDDGKRVSVAGIRRSIQQMYEAAEGYEPLVIGLTQYRNPYGRAYFHSAAVAGVTMLIARKLGLKRAVAAELMLSALLYDIARQGLTDPFEGGALNPMMVQQAQRSLQLIPLRSVVRMLAGDFSQDALHRAAVAFEATQPSNPRQGRLPPSMAARIVAVASAYQLLTVPPPPRRGLTPDVALRLILANAGGRYDPAASELLAIAIGRCPIGTVVQLSTGELGVVAGVPADPRQVLAVPVRLFRDAQGGDMTGVVDVGTPGNPRTIQAIVDPHKVGISVPRILMGDLSRAEGESVGADASAPSPQTPALSGLLKPEGHGAGPQLEGLPPLPGAPAMQPGLTPEPLAPPVQSRPSRPRIPTATFTPPPAPPAPQLQELPPVPGATAAPMQPGLTPQPVAQPVPTHRSRPRIPTATFTPPAPQPPAQALPADALVPQPLPVEALTPAGGLAPPPSLPPEALTPSAGLAAPPPSLPPETLTPSGGMTAPPPPSLPPEALTPSGGMAAPPPPSLPPGALTPTPGMGAPQPLPPGALAPSAGLAAPPPAAHGIPPRVPTGGFAPPPPPSVAPPASGRRLTTGLSVPPPGSVPPAPGQPMAAPPAPTGQRIPTGSPGVPPAPGGQRIPTHSPVPHAPAGQRIPTGSPGVPPAPSGQRIPTGSPGIPPAPSGQRVATGSPAIPPAPSGQRVPTGVPAAPAGHRVTTGVPMPAAAPPAPAVAAPPAAGRRETGGLVVPQQRVPSQPAAGPVAGAPAQGGYPPAPPPGGIAPSPSGRRLSTGLGQPPSVQSAPVPPPQPHFQSGVPPAPPTAPPHYQAAPPPPMAHAQPPGAPPPAQGGRRVATGFVPPPSAPPSYGAPPPPPVGHPAAPAPPSAAPAAAHPASADLDMDGGATLIMTKPPGSPLDQK